MSSTQQIKTVVNQVNREVCHITGQAQKCLEKIHSYVIKQLLASPSEVSMWSDKWKNLDDQSKEIINARVIFERLGGFISNPESAIRRQAFFVVTKELNFFIKPEGEKYSKTLKDILIAYHSRYSRFLRTDSQPLDDTIVDQSYGSKLDITPLAAFALVTLCEYIIAEVVEQAFACYMKRCKVNHKLKEMTVQPDLLETEDPLEEVPIVLCEVDIRKGIELDSELKELFIKFM